MGMQWSELKYKHPHIMGLPYMNLHKATYGVNDVGLHRYPISSPIIGSFMKFRCFKWANPWLCSEHVFVEENPMENPMNILIFLLFLVP